MRNTNMDMYINIKQGAADGKTQIKKRALLSSSSIISICVHHRQQHCCQHHHRWHHSSSLSASPSASSLQPNLPSTPAPCMEGQILGLGEDCRLRKHCFVFEQILDVVFLNQQTSDFQLKNIPSSSRSLS